MGAIKLESRSQEGRTKPDTQKKHRVDVGAVQFPPRVVSGARPTLGVHLGYYFGALKQHLTLQHEYPGQSFFLIADYHALAWAERGVVAEGTLELATTYLSLGLDPSKAVLYRQSDVPESTELAWVLSCLSHVDDLRALPAYSSAAVVPTQITVGLLSYPVLVAADIMGLRGTIIPVGSDQRPLIEKAQDLALRFNRHYESDFFPVPDIRLNESHSVPGIDGRKMGYSHDNVLLLFERFNELQRKVIAIKTDGKGKREPKDPCQCTVFQLYSLVAPEERVLEMRERYLNGGYAYDDAKRELILAILEYFSAFQDTYLRLKRDRDCVADVLREGHKQARVEAKATLEHVRELVGLSSL